MISNEQSAGGVPVTTRLAINVEDFATRVIAYAGEVPVGTVRVRWFQSFAMTERLAVVQRFRGHGIGGLLLERCRQLAQSRGCNVLYAQVMPGDTGYWEEQGWRRLVPQAQSKSGAGAIVSMVKAADPTRPLPEVEAPDAIVLRHTMGMPVGAIRH
jgi:GNAT superfamily N-acetyltransferase